jgi:protoporphyrinogen oxidase
MEKIYIIGAGVSGLIAAYELEKEGYHPIIVDQSDQVGGRVKTLQEDNFALDLGFQVLLSAYPLANEYLDMDGLDLRKLNPGALIYANDKSYLIGDPLRNWKVLIPTLFADVGSIGDKLRILRLNLKLKQKSIQAIFDTPETTTQEYLEKLGFSNKIINRFFKPFFSGIFLEPDLKTSSRMFEFVYKMFGEGHATIPRLGIGEISKELKNRLNHTDFIFNSNVREVTSEHILLSSGDKIPHEGAIVTANASSLIKGFKEKELTWKSCMCVYFEVDKTNIPDGTIALVSNTENFSNNLYAYQDEKTKRTILSVTTLKLDGYSDQEIIDAIISEVKEYTDALKVNYIKHYKINQALPDIQNLRYTAQPDDMKAIKNVYISGDYLFNGSLNAAMESGRLAAKGLLESKS